MIDYVENIIIPYVKRVRSDLGNDKAALVITDNFRGQTTKAVLDLLESANILVALLPPNTTDALQPIGLSRKQGSQTSSTRFL